MDIFPILHTLEKLEAGLADLYAGWSRRFATDPEVSRMFDQLAAEETGHANLVRYEIRLALQNPGLFDAEIDVEPIHRAQERVETLLARRESLGLLPAVRAALECEADLTETYCQTAIAKSNPGTAQLIRALAEGCTAHGQGLERLAAARGWLPPSAPMPPGPAG